MKRIWMMAAAIAIIALVGWVIVRGPGRALRDAEKALEGITDFAAGLQEEYSVADSANWNLKVGTPTVQDKADVIIVGGAPQSAQRTVVEVPVRATYQDASSDVAPPKIERRFTVAGMTRWHVAPLSMVRSLSVGSGDDIDAAFERGVPTMQWLLGRHPRLNLVKGDSFKAVLGFDIGWATEPLQMQLVFSDVGPLPLRPVRCRGLNDRGCQTIEPK